MLEVCLLLIDGEEEKELFREFYWRYEKKLYAVALNILHSPALAEEAESEAFLRVAQHFEKFLNIYRKSRQEIEPWAVIIVRNISLDMLEKEKRYGALPEGWDGPGQEKVEQQSGYLELVALIRAMPEQYRRILELKFVEEQTSREIARRLGLSVAAVEKRVSRGRGLLMEKLKEEGYGDGR